MDDLVQYARAYATKKHEGQTRRDGATPYITHPIRVADRLKRAGVDRPQLLAAALLHDVVEDTGTRLEEIVKDFGPEVAAWVQEVSREPGLLRRSFMERAKAGSPHSVLLRLADRLDNLEDATGLEPNFRPVYATEALRLVAFGLRNARLDELSGAERHALRELAAQVVEASLSLLEPRRRSAFRRPRQAAPRPEPAL